MPETQDPPNKVLTDAVLAGLKHGVVFLVDGNDVGSPEVERLAKKTEVLALNALHQQFGAAARKFFKASDNPWILRTTFGGWVFFYPIELLSPDHSMSEVGNPDFVYWPDADGNYAQVPWGEWIASRRQGHVWRPTTMHRPRSVWERLRKPG